MHFFSDTYFLVYTLSVVLVCVGCGATRLHLIVLHQKFLDFHSNFVNYLYSLLCSLGAPTSFLALDIMFRSLRRKWIPRCLLYMGVSLLFLIMLFYSMSLFDGHIVPRTVDVVGGILFSVSRFLEQIPLGEISGVSEDGNNEEEKNCCHFLLNQQDGPTSRNKMYTLIHCFSKLEEQVENFNALFGWRLVAEMWMFLCLIIFSIYFFATSLDFAEDLTFANMFLTFYTFVPLAVIGHSILLICQASTALTKGSMEFAKRLDHTITTECMGTVYVDQKYNGDDNQAFIIALQTTMSRLSTRPVQISCNFFVMNSALLTSARIPNFIVIIRNTMTYILGTCTMYLMILVQFQISDNDSLHRMKILKNFTSF
ncbi:uncharacterized protein LOC118434780 [Folsomia candida]|uniref:uncharacterized protein LOC118434780 n=1 Tax=Folsomia candida TaxID=158441 RepID=UPI0016053C27|nr:uncharacterized protein LOC118434780 [Folsomia candida]